MHSPEVLWVFMGHLRVLTPLLQVCLVVLVLPLPRYEASKPQAQPFPQQPRYEVSKPQGSEANSQSGGVLQTKSGMTTVVAVAAFLDAFQKVADLANNSRGKMGTRSSTSWSWVFLDCLINPLQEQMEEWKRVANTLDKDHAKEYKKARQEIKKRSSDTLKLQKKAKKADVFGRGDLQPQLDSAMQDVSDKYLLLEETEKQAVRRALVEERSRFCCFVSMLRPVVEEEMSMLGEITHLQTLTDDLKMLTMDPHKLPASSEQVIVDLKGSECTWSYQTPPSSPSTTVSRKSSMCSSLNSVNSSDSRSSGSHCHSPTSHFRYRASSSSSSSVLPQQTPARLSSISSHDSGFISQDAYQSKSPSPMPPETLQVTKVAARCF
ncbi:protein MTSS 1-like [Neolamprologus brichardi]|uniref:protein MTSS 1-like n=1 Tax=Neolamprologus brichardi TaxID=32507 RepID=UPI0016439E96|nr:protein MTSS 1-like [Neolamprologus brichardi]